MLNGLSCVLILAATCVWTLSNRHSLSRLRKDMDRQLNGVAGDASKGFQQLNGILDRIEADQRQFFLEAAEWK